MKQMVEDTGDIKNIIPIEDFVTGTVQKLSLKEAIAYMESWRGYYAPRVRNPGIWVVQGHKDGKYVREHFRTRFMANKEKIRMERAGFTVKDVHEDERIPEAVYQEIRAADTEKLVTRAAQKLGLDQEIYEEFRAGLLQETADLIRVRGFRSHMVKRRKDAVVKGYVEDPLERFLMYSSNISSGLAKAETAKRMAQELGKMDEIKDSKAFTAAHRYVKEQLRNQDKIDRYIGLAKSVTSMKYLGIPNTRSPVVNLTAMVTTVPPAIYHYVLGGKGNAKSMIRPLIKSGNDFGKFQKLAWNANKAGKKPQKPKGLNQDEFDFLINATMKGHFAAQHTRDAMGAAENQLSKGWSKAMNVSMSLFGITERFNRGTTMLAAYRLAKKNGKSSEEAARLAKLASDKAHGLYGKATLPAWAQGTNPLAKLGQLSYV
jgi:hypothetical protein